MAGDRAKMVKDKITSLLLRFLSYKPGAIVLSGGREYVVDKRGRFISPFREWEKQWCIKRELSRDTV